MAKWEKMSKSRGNVVLPQEVVYGVESLAPGYEFRFASGEVADYREYGIWRDKGGTEFFYTDTRHGRRPVFLCLIGEEGAPPLYFKGEEHEQHPGFEDVEYFAYVAKDQ